MLPAARKIGRRHGQVEAPHGLNQGRATVELHHRGEPGVQRAAGDELLAAHLAGGGDAGAGGVGIVHRQGFQSDSSVLVHFAQNILGVG